MLATRTAARSCPGRSGSRRRSTARRSRRRPAAPRARSPAAAGRARRGSARRSPPRRPAPSRARSARSSRSASRRARAAAGRRGPGSHRGSDSRRTAPRARCRRAAARPARSGTAPRRRRSRAPKPAPWKLSQNEIVLCRPVTARASLSAISIACRAARREQDLGEVAGRERGQLRGQRHRRLVGEPPRRERQLVELRLERGNQSRMAVAEVVDVVAVKIHVSAAGQILEPKPVRAAQRGEAGRRQGLMKEVAGVGLDQRPHGRVEAPGEGLADCGERLESPSAGGAEPRLTLVMAGESLSLGPGWRRRRQASIGPTQARAGNCGGASAVAVPPDGRSRGAYRDGYPGNETAVQVFTTRKHPDR